MAGGTLKNVRRGDEAELLAHYVLEHIAYVTRVRREEDIGADLLCTLFKAQNDSNSNMIEAGPSFSVQVKSNSRDITFDKPHQVRWISNLDNPYIVGVVDVEQGTLSLYSTGRVLRVALHKFMPKVRLILRQQSDGDFFDYGNDNTSVSIYLGEPILSFDLVEIRDRDVVEDRRKVLEQWIRLDRRNIIRKEAAMYWVEVPLEYELNAPIDPRAVGIQFYYNPKNLNKTMDNFVWGCIGVVQDLRKLNELKIHKKIEDAYDPDLDNFREGLEAFLIKKKDVLTERHRALLRKFLLMELD